MEADGVGNDCERFLLFIDCYFYQCLPFFIIILSVMPVNPTRRRSKMATCVSLTWARNIAGEFGLFLLSVRELSLKGEKYRAADDLKQKSMRAL